MRTLADRLADRLIWGSDWPHTSSHRPGARGSGFRPIDTARLLADMTGMIDSPELARRIFRTNPARLYGR